MDSVAIRETHQVPSSRFAPSDASLGRSLQLALVLGWEEFLKSDKLRALRAFASFLDGGLPGEPDRRLKLPHPAYEVAALYIAIPFAEELRARGLSIDSWFPGDVERSEEIPWLDEEGNASAWVGARVFHSYLLNADGSRLCRIAITFPYLKEGFGFPCPPSLSVMFDRPSSRPPKAR